MIKERRNKLQAFIKEQIIGPGAMKYKYCSIDTELLPIDSDILIAPPASIYSTSILFPIKSSTTNKEEKEDGEENKNQNDNIDGEEDPVDLIEENPAPMFNNAVGISFVVDNIKSLSQIKLSISGRKYHKLKSKEIKNIIGVKLNGRSENFKSQLSQFESIKNLIKITGETAKVTDGFDFVDTAKEFREELKVMKSNFCGLLIAELDLDKTKYKYLASVESYLYSRLRDDRTTSLLNSLAKIERLNEFETIVKDLLKLERGSWISKNINQEIDLTLLPFKEFEYRDNFLYRKYKKELFNVTQSDDKFLNLSCNVSLSKNRRQSADKKIYVKIQLVNTSPEVQGTERHYYSVVNDDVNLKCLFDTKINIKGTIQNLRPYNEIEFKTKDSFEEDETTKFLYRRFKDYALGHNCSAEWNCVDEEVQLNTTFLPIVETPDIDTIPRDINNRIRKNDLFTPAPYIADPTCIEIKSLSTLSDLNNESVISQLETFNNYYSSWIESKRAKTKEHPGLISQELNKCEKDFERIKRNIEALKQNDKALRAFRLMNTSMFMQMWHSQNVKDNLVLDFINDSNFKGFTEEFYTEQSDTIFDNNSVGWRPFQLAFILLNIDGIVRIGNSDTWPERNELVDLVWFPTGGGKTEAYLGIIAFTITYRRLLNAKKGGGVSAIMRYTLRLLTLQQFQRATNLIICLELTRRWDEEELGKEPITIGMWVGKNSMPNTREDLTKEIENIDLQIENYKGDGIPDVKTKIPFSQCPCCGTHLFSKAENYKTTKLEDNYSANSIKLKCLNKKCSFAHPPKRFRRSDQYALPILLSDEDIYENPPTLLFGTVDKFALLAHKTSSGSKNRQRDSRRIFGNTNCTWESFRRDGYNPPDLIIQDELHLLSGPLGTAVALFENAVDQLCIQEIDGVTVRPKIVSSTATTRNTSSQIAELYNRDVNLFPKPGIDCDDSFFSFYKRNTDSEDGIYKFQSKRKYVGILPTGRTQMWMQMRLSALCFIHRLVCENEYLSESVYEEKNTTYPLKAIDYYYTLISYFNSKKEVGKTSSQVDTYLIKELRKVFAMVARPGKSLYNYYCKNLRQIELTGRLSGPEVQKNLSIVEDSFDDNKRLEGKTPPDLVIATNMISVGLDVSRFNVILMNSMPRNIAEYIQASSRVGRNKEGLVLTLHHPFRSRDLSHFETFIDFHEKFYGYVEPISITPFAEKALKRYLNLYVATLIRQTEFPDNNNAFQIDAATIQNMKNDILDFFKNGRQTLGIGIPLSDEVISTIETIVANALDDWLIQKNSKDDMWFNNPREKESNLYISINEYESNIAHDFWKIPMSLRSVEPETVVRILNK